MKKAIKVFIIIFIISNLILSVSNINTVLAAGGITTEAGFNNWNDTGKTTATLNGSEKTVTAQPTRSSVAATSNVISDILMVIPSIASKIMTMVVRPNYIDEEKELKDLKEKALNSVSKEEKIRIFNGEDPRLVLGEERVKSLYNVVTEIYSKFTIQNLVMGYYDIFNINFFDNINEAAVIERSGGTADFGVVLKTNIARFYYFIRTLAIIINLICLIYIGIRMAISTISEQKARYKKLLKSWFVGMVLLFIMQYLVIFMLELSDVIQTVIVKFGSQLNLNSDFEYNVVNRIETNYTTAPALGFAGVTSVIIYWMVIYYQLKFFIMYVTRLLEVAILIIISPLITITYSIDKSADGRSQAFNTWVRELASKIFLQNLHCLAYFVFVFSAGNIAIKAPILAILFLGCLSRVEKIVANVFKINGKGLKDIKLPFFNK